MYSALIDNKLSNQPLASYGQFTSYQEFAAESLKDPRFGLTEVRGKEQTNPPSQRRQVVCHLTCSCFQRYRKASWALSLKLKRKKVTYPLVGK